MRQLKQLFVGVLITMIVVLVFIFIYRDDDIDPMMPDFPPGLSQEEKVKIVQKEWQRMEKIVLDSPEATNLVKRLVEEKSSILTPLQKTLLEEKLTAWFYQLKTGSYEDFMAFREPDYWNVSQSRQDSIKHAFNWWVLNKSNGDASALNSLPEAFRMFRQSDTNALDHLPKSKWPRVVHDFQTTLRLDSIRVDSIHFNVRKWRQRVESMLKPFLFYPGNSRASQGNRFHIKTKEPIIGYHVKPIDVMKKHWGIEWARFRAGYDPIGFDGFVSAIELALYWSPDEKRWLAGECLSVGVPKSLLSKAYLSENMDMRPNIYF